MKKREGLRTAVLPAVFVLTIVLQLLLLFAAALIPKSAVEEHFASSARFLCEKEPFFDLPEKTPAGRIDRYADAIWLNIAWNLEPSTDSILWARFYDSNVEEATDDFRLTLEEKRDADTEYMRYWHCSSALLRIFHLFTDMRGIYAGSAVLLVLLYGALFAVLLRRRLFREVIAVFISLIAVNIWYVPLAFNYLPCFLIAAVSCLFVVRTMGRMGSDAGKGALLLLFFLTGMLTNAFDFLTCEVVTLGLPLLLTVSLMIRKKGEAKWKDVFSFCVIWGTGYCLCWIFKWILTALVSGQNVLPYLSDHVEERMGTYIPAGRLPLHLCRTLGRNLSCLFPAGYGAAGRIAAVFLVLLFIYICFVYRKKVVYKKGIVLYAFISEIPYLRYLVMHSHSYGHFFFTYRAQMVTACGLSLLAALLVAGTGSADKGAR